MSAETVEGFVSYGDWNKESDAHPALGFMHKYTEWIDNVRDVAEFDDWMTPDFTAIKTDGEVITGGKPAFEAILKVYGMKQYTAHASIDCMLTIP